MSKIQLETLEPRLLQQSLRLETLQVVSSVVVSHRSIESKRNNTHDKTSRHSFY
jgi:hypothetical protein